MAVTALSHRANALKSRILRCFSAVSAMDKRRRAQAEGELALAEAHIEKGELSAARKHLSNILVHVWENGLAWMHRDTTGSMPLHVRAWELMAKTYFDEGDKARGNKCIELANLAAAEIGLLHSGIKQMEKGKPGNAVQSFAKAQLIGKKYCTRVSKLLGRKAEGGGSMASLSLGYVYMMAGDFNTALGEVERSLKQCRNNFEAWAAMAFLLDIKGNEREAEKWYSKVIEKYEKGA